jgi:hypothetical protein
VFFVALAKETDHLKGPAQRMLERHGHDLTTSVITVLEALLIAGRKGINPKLLVGSIFKLPRVEGMTPEEARLVKNRTLNAFDAMPAVLSRGDSILTSDRRIGSAGFTVIPLTGGR